MIFHWIISRLFKVNSSGEVSSCITAQTGWLHAIVQSKRVNFKSHTEITDCEIFVILTHTTYIIPQCHWQSYDDQLV